TDFTGFLLRTILRAHADVLHRQRSGKFLGSPGRFFRDSGGQLPLTQHSGISEHLERLGVGRSGKSSQRDWHKECSHDVLLYLVPRAPQRFFRNVRASVTSTLVLSAPPAVATIFS